MIDASARGADGVKLGDLNRDGRPDLVTGWEEGGVVRVYLNPGKERVKGAWETMTVGKVMDAEEAIFTDLDGDGKLEVVSGWRLKGATNGCNIPSGGRTASSLT